MDWPEPAVRAGRAKGRGAVFVYKITNLVNGKAYIGITRRSSPDIRWRRHFIDARAGRGHYLHSAIRSQKDGDFICECLYEATSERELRACERALIAAHGTLAPNGYNLTLTDGGRSSGWVHSIETRQKMSASRLKKPPMGMLGKKHSEATKAAMRVAHQAHSPLTADDVALIKLLSAHGYGKARLEMAFGVDRNRIRAIKRGQAWTNIAPLADDGARVCWIGDPKRHGGGRRRRVFQAASTEKVL